MSAFYPNSNHATGEGGGGAPQAAQAPATGRFYSHPSSNHASGTEAPQGRETLMGGGEPETREDRIARALYDEAPTPVELDPVSDEIAEIRRARYFDPQTTHRESVPDDGFVVDGVDPADARRAAAEVRELVADLGLSPSEVRELADRSAMLAREPVDVERQRADAVRALNAAFGQAATEALSDARLLLARDPRAARTIEALGLGDDARTIVRLAEEARRQIARGVLRRPEKARG